VRVLVVTNLWPTPERPASGPFVRDQVEALRAIDGLEIELFTFGTGPRAYLDAARELRRRYRGERFDLVHAHYGLAGISALGVGGDAPLVVTFHGTDLAHPRVGPMSRALARRIALPAPVSAGLARAGLKRQVASGGRLAVLPCGVNLDRFARIERADARRRLGLDPDKPYLLFPADPARPEKRFDRAQQIARRTGATLLNYVARDPDEVPLLINAANAVLVTSEREGFGLAPLEALACDVPVLATPVGIAPLALADVAGAHCDEFSENEWHARAQTLVEAPDPRVDGRRRAALFDRNRFAERVFKAYQDVLRAPL
jgi:teichuronic acid biosynthesis glycosyltransferase TuaC